MAIKFFLILSLATITYAGVIPDTTVVETVETVEPGKQVETVIENGHPVVEHVEDFDPHPQYRFAYDVQDSISGDSKSQVEERDGEVVRGEYSLVDADGFKRIVQYTADPVNGFQADVQRIPIVKSLQPLAHIDTPTVIKSVAPITSYSAPSIVKTTAPLTQFVAPVAQYSAPVAQYAAPAIVKSLIPSSYATQQSFVRNIAPVAHLSYTPTFYSTYAAPTTFYTHH